MRKEFDDLLNMILLYRLVIDDDLVLTALDNLSNKINEVEKRLECIDKTLNDIRGGVHKINEIKHSSFGSTIDAILNDDILRGTYDIAIAIDLNDEEPISENWYGLFKEKSEVDKLVERVEMIENNVELTEKFREKYVTDFAITKASIKGNLIKEEAIEFIKELTEDYEG
jgi:hypothetical protein